MAHGRLLIKTCVIICLIFTNTVFAVNFSFLKRGAGLGKVGQSMNRNFKIVDYFFHENQNSYKLLTLMSEYIKKKDNFSYAICNNKYNGDADCVEAVNKYVNNCKAGDCFNFDLNHIVVPKLANPILLPDVYQLEAAFFAFRMSEFYNKKYFERKWKKMLNFEHGYSSYNVLSNALLMHFTRLKFIDKMQEFLSIYLFGATIYYKTYIERSPRLSIARNFTKIVDVIFGNPMSTELKRLGTLLVLEAGSVDIHDEIIYAIRPLYTEYMKGLRPEYNDLVGSYSLKSIEILNTVVNKALDKASVFSKFIKFLFVKPVQKAGSCFKRNIGTPISRGINSLINKIKGKSNDSNADNSQD